MIENNNKETSISSNRYLMIAARQQDAYNLKKGGYQQLKVILKQEIRKLLQRAGCVNPPIQLNKVAQNLGVAIDTTHHVSCKGALCSKENNKVILVDKGLSSEKQQFVIAHEITHVLIARIMAETKKLRIDAPSKIEGLCDWGALEILIPYDWLLEKAIEPKPKGELILEIASICGISPILAAKRFSEYPLKKNTVIFWQQSKKGFFASDAFPAPNSPPEIFYLPTKSALRNLRKTIKSNKPLSTTLELMISGERNPYDVQLYPLHDGICMSVTSIP